MTLEISFSEGRLCGAIPQLGIFTQGETLDDLLRNVQEALELYYEDEQTNEISLQNLQLSLAFNPLSHAINV